MNDFQFAEPQLVHGLWLVLAAVAALVWMERRGGQALGRFVSEALQGRLVTRPGGLQRGLRIAFIGLSAAFLVVALMRPQWGGELVRSSRVGAEIMIALDVSRSMLAEDVAPNRLERAKAEIRDLLGYLEGNQVGLIAFAGRASVVAPLTPDFGFLRLVLDTIDTHTVRRGGTRLEEPIRKALAGFGEAGDLSRILLLITDGEDHESFPLDAAEAAAERGIRIIAVGFGDEAGSEIRVTDPRTGGRSLLRDGDGRAVVTRLDGALLRDLALATEGAYIPAGTGVLDLESIFDAHIAPLMRSQEETRVRAVRNEGYPWAVLLALLFLIASTAAHAARPGRSAEEARGSGGPGGRAIGSALLIGALVAGAPNPGMAQTNDPNSPGAAAEAALPEAEAGGREKLEISEDPREAYNAGLDALHTDRLDDAERLFEAARSNAGIDGETRFRASYNLGWVDVKRADFQLDNAPADALRSLERAVDWFRSAIALRPKHEESRRNLEILLQRILALADSLADHDPSAIQERLEVLIERQRALLTPLRGLVEAAARSDDPHVVEELRQVFRHAEVEERALLDSAQELARLANDELEMIGNVPEEERTPENHLREAQLTGLLHYLHRGRERMGQARSQLRQRQAERGYRRGSAALAALKRARDQLLDPVQVLDALLGDATTRMTETRKLGMLSSPGMGLGGDAGATPKAPAWLTASYLAERQDELTQRAGELAARLRAGLEQEGAVEDPEQQALLAQVREAEPFVTEAESRFRDAFEVLDGGDAADAVQPQIQGITALAQARERFFDLKRLIEAAYADERQVEAILDPKDDPETGTTAEQTLAQLPEYAGVLAGAQANNLSRVQRMRPLLEEQLAQVDAPRPEDEGLDPEAIAESRDQERKNLELALEILALTESAMTSAGDSLPSLADSLDALEPARTSVAQAVMGLENLRRLFFSILEHLRDAARQQQEINDETADTTALAEADAADLSSQLAPLAARQERLAGVTDQIAMALHEQSLQDPAELAGSPEPLDEEQAQAITERFVRASELVLSAQQDMAGAAAGMSEEEPPVARVRDQQTSAFDNLVEALQILQPPPEEQPQDDPQEQQDQQQQQEQQQGQQPQPEAQPEETQGQDPSQLLQQVRDREAQRHRDQRNRGRAPSEPVEKDW